MQSNKTILWLLALLTLAALLLSIPALNLAYLGLGLLFFLLAAISVYFSILLIRGEISMAYLLGILGILLLPGQAQATLLWSLVLGSLAGALLRSRFHRWQPAYHHSAPLLQGGLIAAAHVGLSLLAAEQLYHGLHGQQPLKVMSQSDLLPVLGMALGYVLVYFVIFLLGVYTDLGAVGPTLRDNRLLLLTVLFVPGPMVILSAGLVYLSPQLALSLLAVQIVAMSGILYIASRIRHHRWRQRQALEALAAISQAIYANQDLNSLLNTVYVELNQLLHIDYFTVVLLNGQQLEIPLRVRHGQILHDSEPVRRQPNTLLDRVLDNQQPLLIASNAMQISRRLGLLPPDDYVSAWLGVPLLAAGHLLGALVIASTDPKQRFGPEELYTLNIIAAATSVNIDNAQLYAQQTERAAKLANLNTVLALLTETLSPDDVLDTLISSATAISEATAVAVYRCQDDGFVMVRSAGLSEGFAANPILVVSGTDDPDQAGLPVLVEDAAEDQRVAHLREAVLSEGKPAWVELPLAVSGQGIGAMTLYYDSVQRFTPEHIEHLRSFANQAAQAIQNADLYAGTYRALELRLEQLSTLAALGRDLLTTMDQEVIAELLLRYTLEASGTQNRSGAAAPGWTRSLCRDGPAGLSESAQSRELQPGIQRAGAACRPDYPREPDRDERRRGLAGGGHPCAAGRAADLARAHYWRARPGQHSAGSFQHRGHEFRGPVGQSGDRRHRERPSVPRRRRTPRPGAGHPQHHDRGADSDRPAPGPGAGESARVPAGPGKRAPAGH